MLRQQAETDRAWRAASAGSCRWRRSPTAAARRPRHPGVRVPAAGAARRQSASRARLGAREHPRPSVRALHSVHPRGDRARVTWSSRRNTAAASATARRSTTRSTTAAPRCDDVVTAASVLATRYPQVDPSRDRRSSAGATAGMITLLSVFRNPATFRAAAAIVPVTNLFQRLARRASSSSGARSIRRTALADSPSERPQVYRERSPLFHVDQAADSVARARCRQRRGREHRGGDAAGGRAARAEAAAGRGRRSIDNPPGGHTFDRRVDPATWEPENTPEQRDSWTRVWAFLERTSSRHRRQRRARPVEARVDRSARGHMLQLVGSSPRRGPVAQLGARMNGIHEVTGSIPVWSTNPFIPNSIGRK